MSEIQQQYKYLSEKFMEAGLTSDQVDKVLDILDNTCTACFERKYPCSCWNDE